MRTADLFGLAISALIHQKARAFLTLLGVVVGSCILTVSLSVGTGVQQTVHRLLRQNDQLRRIEVMPGYRLPADVEPPPEAVAVKGEMSEERRQRLAQQLRQEWLQRHTTREAHYLTRPVLNRFAARPRVESVLPQFFGFGKLKFNGKTEQVSIVGAPPGHRRFTERQVAGRAFSSAHEHSILVNEWLLYRWGFPGDADIVGALGKTMALEITPVQRSPWQMIALIDPEFREMTPENERLLRVASDKLPALLMSLNLGEHNAAWQKLVSRFHQPNSLDKPAPAAELQLAGVFRYPNDEEIKRFWERFDEADVIIPIGTAEELLFKIPGKADRGFDRAVVLAKDESDVRALEDDIKAEGFQTYSMVEFADRVKTEVTLIRISMTFISFVALAVAALGITNTMVTSVLERVREIGIMKSVGARDGHILLAFLLEGTFLGMIGGALGLATGWLISLPCEGFARRIIEKQATTPVESDIFVFPIWLVGGIPLVTALVTTLAAAYPARRAARVDPVVALKYE